MHTIQATPQYLTRVLGMTKDEHNMPAIALEYTLRQVRYNAKRDRYFLKCYEPNGLTTVMEPAEFAVLEEVVFRVAGEAFGGFEVWDYGTFPYKTYGAGCAFYKPATMHQKKINTLFFDRFLSHPNLCPGFANLAKGPPAEWPGWHKYLRAMRKERLLK